MAGRPVKWDNPEDMGETIESYFASCETKQEPFTVGGLAYALNLTTEGLREYEAKPQFSALIKRAKQRIKAEVEKALVSGKPAAGLIFWLKNQDNWKDEQKISQDVTINDKREMSEEDLLAIASRGSKGNP